VAKGASGQWQWQEATSLEARRRALSGAMGPSPGDTERESLVATKRLTSNWRQQKREG